MDLARTARPHDLTAARTYRITRICERQGVPVLADRAYIGASSWVTTPIRRLPHQDLTATHRTINRALSAARAPVERSVARLKAWRVFRRARCSPHRMTVIAAAVRTLERQRWKRSVKSTAGVEAPVAADVSAGRVLSQALQEGIATHLDLEEAG